VLPLYTKLPENVTLNAVKTALQTPWAGSTIQQLVAMQITNQHQYLEDVTRAFRGYFVASLDLSAREAARSSNTAHWPRQEDLAHLASAAFEILERYARAAAEYFSKNDSAQERALSWAQATLANEIIGAIARYTAITARQQRYTATERYQWINTYSKAFTAKHQDIPLPDLKTRRSVYYEHIYVAPTLRRAEDDADLALDSVVTDLDRIVILGDPGAGKSTVSSIMALKLFQERNILPLYVVLREVNMSKEGFAVVDSIENRIRNAYQVDPLPGLLEELLLEGSAGVIFDGLDELLDPRDRKKAAEVIEAISSRYPLAPILVTCRHVGYAEARLNEHIFQELSIRPFNTGQVGEYAHKWFSHTKEHLADSLEKTAESFMEASETASDLRSNPLLLSFICIMYRGKRYIPKDRPQLYRHCIELLLGEWDLARQITDDLVDLQMYQLALAEVANVATSQLPYQHAMPFAVLIETIAHHLRDDAGYREADAKASAEEIARMCKGRAWIFTDVGLEGAEEPSYAFTHASFREYFYAWHISRVNRNPEELADVLYGLLSEGRSEIAVQIAISLCDASVKNGGSQCVLALARKISNAPRSVMSEDSKAAAFTTLWEAADLVYLQDDALFELVTAMFWEAIGPMTRLAKWFHDIRAHEYKHSARAMLICPAVFRRMTELLDTDEERIRLLWFCNEAEQYMPEGATFASWLLPIENVAADLEGLVAPNAARMRADDRARTAELASNLGVRRGTIALATDRLGSGEPHGLVEILTPCAAEIADFGDDVTALWVIRKMASPIRTQKSVAVCLELLRRFGDVGNLAHYLDGLTLSVWGRRRIESGASTLLRSLVIDRALRSCAGYDLRARKGLALLVILVLDVFTEFYASVATSHKDELEREFIATRELLVRGSWDFPKEWREYIVAWVGGSIWGHEVEEFGVS
jgi:hypothetical protein